MSFPSYLLFLNLIFQHWFAVSTDHIFTLMMVTECAELVFGLILISISIDNEVDGIIILKEYLIRISKLAK